MPSYAITGAARGLGFEHIRQLSADPANTVFALVRNIGTATKLRDLAAQRPNVHVLQGDVTKPDELASAAAAVAAITSGSLDVLIHNATASLNPDEFLAPSQLPSDSAALRAAFDPMFSTNIYGAVWVTNAFLPLVEKGTVKKIIHLSSGMSDIDCVLGAGIDYTVPYAVSKSGTNMLVAKYAVELAPKGIKVLALSPGWVNTSEDTGPVPPEIQAAGAKMLKEFQRVDPTLKGPITPEESVRKQLAVIDKLDEKMSGHLFTQNGRDRRDWF